MIIDCHTHLWKPEHINKRLAKEIDAARGWMTGKNIHDAGCDRHFNAMKPVDKAIVFGWPGVIDVPNDFVARYANSHSEKIVGFASIDPHRKDAVKEVKRCAKELGLRGLKLYPITQHFYPNDKVIYPICEVAQKLDMAILWHLSPIFIRDAPLRYSQPLLLEDLALEFPELKMIVAHMGWPRELETLALIRKQPNIYADVSGRPVAQHYRFYNTMISAVEYGVCDKLLFGSDWPIFTFEETVQALRDVNKYTKGTKLPRIPDEIIQAILTENVEKALEL